MIDHGKRTNDRRSETGKRSGLAIDHSKMSLRASIEGSEILFQARDGSREYRATKQANKRVQVSPANSRKKGSLSRVSAIEGLEASFTPSTTATTPSTPQELQENSFFSHTALLPPILSHLGFHELATAAPSLSDSAASAASAWLCSKFPETIFAPSDASLRTCFSFSFPNLLREHIVPGLFTIDYMRRLSFGTKIETLSPGRCITVTSDSVNRKTSTTASAKVFFGGVEITQPDLFNNGMVVIHGLQGFIAPFSCSHPPI
ncbi:hypothetical protein HN51_043359 [Arachis hypogaea]